MSSADHADAGIPAWVARATSVPAGVALLIATVVVTILAVADIYFDPQLSFLILYSFPVLFAAWNAGRAGGIVISLMSGAAWVIDEIVTAGRYSAAAIPVWNDLAKGLVLMMLVWVITALKRALESRYRAEQRRFRFELELAAEVQRQLLPASLPVHEGVEIAVLCRPVSTIGGDYYDFFELPDGRLAVIIADASGHGIGAALTMARLHGLLQSEAADFPSDPTALVARLNELMHRGPETRHYATIFCGIWNCARDRLEWVSGGHLPQLLVRAPSAPTTRLDSTGPAIGLLPGAKFRKRDVEVYPGDLVALFTDGLTEAVDAAGGEFGIDRLTNTLVANQRRSLDDVRGALLQAFEEHAAGGTSGDDVTLILVRRR